MAEQQDSRTEYLLLRHLAADLREHVIGVAADQSYRSDHNDQNYCEHHRVFGDVLATLFLPKLTHCFNHFSPNSTTGPAGTPLPKRFAVVWKLRYRKSGTMPNSTRVTLYGTKVL